MTPGEPLSRLGWAVLAMFVIGSCPSLRGDSPPCD